jgi:hypothetical protein
MTQDTQRGDAPAARPEQADDEAVRVRAYEISQRPDAGTPDENWDRAAAELGVERDAAIPEPS